MSKSPNTQPLFVRSHKIWSVTLQTELGSLDPNSTSTPKTFIIGSDPSDAIETIQIQSTGQSIETVLNLYLFNAIGTAGKNLLISQTIVPASDNSGIYAPIIIPNLPITYFPNNGAVFNSQSSGSGSTTILGVSGSTRILRLPEGWELRAALSTAIANPIILTAFGGSYA